MRHREADHVRRSRLSCRATLKIDLWLLGTSRLTYYPQPRTRPGMSLLATYGTNENRMKRLWAASTYGKLEEEGRESEFSAILVARAGTESGGSSP